MFKNILVALKFSPASRYALTQGIDLARHHSAQVRIFHALEYSLKDRDGDDPERRRAEQSAQARFDEEIRPLIGEFQGIEFEAFPGDPAMAICRLALETKSDLIVLGCHQHPDKASLMRVDYVGHTILEKAPCPVILIPFHPI